MDRQEIIYAARQVFDTEIEALQLTRDSIDDTFCQILDKIVQCKGKVVITGMGKPGHIATKIAATLSSLGTSSFFLHPAEAMHGDLGMIGKDDVVIMISYSGESNEITRIIPNIKAIGAFIIAISGNENSTLVKNSDLAEVFPKFDEACTLKLAPTSSTTAALAYGDALAVVASQIYGFTKESFGMFHPAGALGRRLLIKADDIMASGENNAVVHIGESLKEAIIILSTKQLGIVTVIDKNEELAGVITDGDLRRQLEKGVDVYSLSVDRVMTRTPKTISTGKMAIDAMNLMKKHRITTLPVVDGNKPIGTVTIQALINNGIIG